MEVVEAASLIDFGLPADQVLDGLAHPDRPAIGRRRCDERGRR